MQEDSQALTCSFYCKFTGTVHLVKRETCESAWSTKMDYFGHFRLDGKPRHEFIFAISRKPCQKPHVWNGTGTQWFLKHLLISPWSPPVLPVTRMRPSPCAFMSGRKAWMVWMVPRRLTSRIFLMESKDCTSSGPISPTPALHTASNEFMASLTHTHTYTQRWQSESGITGTRAYPECPLVSPQPCPWHPGWTAGWSRPFVVCPRCPCAGLSHSLKDVPFWLSFSSWHKLDGKKH